jgi:curved DNA-binding protein
MAFIDYYKILEINKNASEAEIKKAYRRLARKYHPDVNQNDPSAEKKFKEINEANEVLTHPENRKKYDAYGENWQQAEQYEKSKRQQQYSREQGSPKGERFGGTNDYSDFFESMFGGTSFRQQRERNVSLKGQDFHSELHLNLQDAYTTHKRTLNVNGKNIRISIPAGLEDGQQIKIKGMGGEGKGGGPKGDLYLTFIIENNTSFKREKNNLFHSLNINLYTAVLGGEITANTFDGKVKLTIKPGTQNGTQVKLKGKGFPIYKKEGQFGDLFFNYQIQIPTHLNEKEKELFEKLSDLRS